MFEKREHVNYLKEVKCIEKRRREALRMIGPSRLQVQPKRQSVKALGVTRIQPTPKSFQVDTIDVVTLQGVDLWKNCAAQDSSESSLASSGCVRQMGVRRARMQNVVCCNHTRVKYVAITWACCTRVAVVRSPEGSLHRSDLLGPRP